jgi:hypothetical protein
MSSKAAMSEVRVKVRRYALMLQEFTKAQIVEATGLNPESVRTELRRMIREGLLHSEPMQDKPPTQRGRPHVYKLTRDTEKRLALSNSIQAFYTPSRPPTPPRPTSPHYYVAKELLDEVAKIGLEPLELEEIQEQKEMLKSARYHLEFAYHEEWGTGEGVETVLAYLDYERGRLAYLCKELDQSEKYLRKAGDVFNTSGTDTMIAMVDAYLVSIAIQRSWNFGNVETPQSKAKLALEILQSTHLTQINPILHLLTGLLAAIPSSAQYDIVWELQEQTRRLQETIIKEIRETLRAEREQIAPRDLVESDYRGEELSSVSRLTLKIKEDFGETKLSLLH